MQARRAGVEIRSYAFYSDRTFLVIRLLADIAHGVQRQQVDQFGFIEKRNENETARGFSALVNSDPQFDFSAATDNADPIARLDAQLLRVRAVYFHISARDRLVQLLHAARHGTRVPMLQHAPGAKPKRILVIRRLCGRVIGAKPDRRSLTVTLGLVEMYALVALIDETILMKKWALKDTWMGNPLQLEHFNEVSAGEEFYSKLDSIRGSTEPGKLAALEVFYLAMAQGFRGKFGDFQGLEKQKLLMQELAGKIRQARPGGMKALSPGWEQEQAMGDIVKEFPVWVIAVAGGAVVLITYIILSAILGGMASTVVDKVG